MEDESDVEDGDDECEDEDEEGEHSEEGEQDEGEAEENHPPVFEDDMQLVEASQDLSECKGGSMEVGDGENGIPEDEQWSQVSTSWLARAYMNPDLKKDPDFNTPREPVEFRAKKEEPAPTETDDVSPSPCAEKGIEDEESDAETLNLEDFWSKEVVNAKPNSNNIFNREALIRLMASLCEKEFHKRLVLKFNTTGVSIFCSHSLEPSV